MSSKSFSKSSFWVALWDEKIHSTKARHAISHFRQNEKRARAGINTTCSRSWMIDELTSCNNCHNVITLGKPAMQRTLAHKKPLTHIRIYNVVFKLTCVAYFWSLKVLFFKKVLWFLQIYKKLLYMLTCVAIWPFLIAFCDVFMDKLNSQLIN